MSGIGSSMSSTLTIRNNYCSTASELSAWLDAAKPKYYFIAKTPITYEISEPKVIAKLNEIKQYAMQNEDNTVYSINPNMAGIMNICIGTGPVISVATKDSAGIVRVGEGLKVDKTGTISAKKDYISLERLDEYVYEITFDNIPEYIPSDIQNSGCSSYVYGGKLYRNFDWHYDESPTFIVKCKEFTGVANGDKLVDGNLDEDILGQLPYRIVDGVNNNGIMMSTHVLYNDWNWKGCGSKTYPLQKLPYLIMTNVKSMTTINTDLGNIISNLSISEALENSEYLMQFVITDGTMTYVLVPPTDATGSYELINATGNPKLTNFRWVGNNQVERNGTYMQNRPTGIERWNLMSTNFKELRFTKAYESADRLSEFIGINGTTKASDDSALTAIYDIAHTKYLGRERNGELWQTVHSAVYTSNGLEHLYVQENWDKDYGKFNQKLYSEIGLNSDAPMSQEATTKMIYQYQEGPGNIPTKVSIKPSLSSALGVEIGYDAKTGTTPTVALGFGTEATGSTATAIGYGAKALGNSSMAFGSCTVNHDYAIGLAAGTSKNNSIACGGRVITDISAGSSDMEAVNYGQIKNTPIATTTGNKTVVTDRNGKELYTITEWNKGVHGTVTLPVGNYSHHIELHMTGSSSSGNGGCGIEFLNDTYTKGTVFIRRRWQNWSEWIFNEATVTSPTTAFIYSVSGDILQTQSVGGYYEGNILVTGDAAVAIVNWHLMGIFADGTTSSECVLKDATKPIILKPYRTLGTASVVRGKVISYPLD